VEKEKYAGTFNATGSYITGGKNFKERKPASPDLIVGLMGNYV